MPTFTMRLPEEDYEALQAMALLTGRSMAELVRDAVSDSLTRFADSDELAQRVEEEVRQRELALETLRQRLPAKLRDASEDPGDSDVPTGKRKAPSRRQPAASATRR
jgi:predicted DNA-binding protein